MAPALLAAIPSLVQLGTGLYQNYKANQVGSRQFQPYKTPDPFMDYINNAQAMAASNQMPGQSRAEDNISASQNNDVRASQETGQSPESMLGTLAALNANTNKAYGDLETKAADFKYNNQQNLQQALVNYSGQKDKEYDNNVKQPYMAAMAAASALRGASGINTTGAVNNLATLGVLANKPKLNLNGLSGNFPPSVDPSTTNSTDNQSQETPASNMVMQNQQNQTQAPYDKNFGVPDAATQLKQKGYTDEQIKDIISSINPNSITS